MPLLFVPCQWSWWGGCRNGLVCPSICPSEGLEEKSNKQFWRYIKSQRLEAFRVTPAEGTRPGSLRLPQTGFHLRLSVQVCVHCLICDEVSANIHVHGPSLPPIPDVIISEQGVKKLLKGVDLRKVFGPDQVPCRMLQELYEELAPVFTAIFRNSHECGNLPEVCKSAWISPVFQKGTKCGAANYRPMSLTCIACKLLEHILCSCSGNHLDRHNALSPYQHGFAMLWIHGKKINEHFLTVVSSRILQASAQPKYQ